MAVGVVGALATIILEGSNADVKLVVKCIFMRRET